MSVAAPLLQIRRRNPALRILYYAAGVLLVALIAAVWWLYSIARSPLPQLDGSIAVPGISSKVRVVRDERGVPTIEAATLEDLFFAQGYVTARDRAYFEAYARGVNAFLESHRDRLSLEFRLLKYTPRPWTVTDSLLVGARMVQDLNHYSYERALTREKILAKVGPQLTADLYVNSSWRDRTPGDVRRIDQEPAANSGDEDDDDDEEVDPEGGNGRLISALPSDLRSPDFRSTRVSEVFVESRASSSGKTAETPVAPLADLEEADVFRPGSNNWVVSGQHTVSGKPLLSNDMHLDHQMPNLWFEAHLKMTTGNLDRKSHV